MRLADFLKQEYIITDLKAREKRELLDEIVTDLASRNAKVNREKLLEHLLEREKLGSTGIGHGVAVPHAKLKGLDEIIVTFGRSKKGVDFNSMDDQPVYLFFMIVAPENSAAAHLKVLAGISNLLKNQEFRIRLMKAGGAAELYKFITEADERINV